FAAGIGIRRRASGARPSRALSERTVERWDQAATRGVGRSGLRQATERYLPGTVSASVGAQRDATRPGPATYAWLSMIIRSRRCRRALPARGRCRTVVLETDEAVHTHR